MVRWAWRLFRREWRQQSLVLALVAVSVAAAVALSTLVINASSAAGSDFGSAHSRVQVDASDPAVARVAVAAAKRRFGTVEEISHRSVAVPGSPVRLDVRGQDPAGHFGHGLLALRHGRYPTTDRDVALTDGAMDLLDAKVGDTVRLGRVQRHVVGQVEDPRDLHDEFALLAPSTSVPADTLTLLVDADRRSSVGGRSATTHPGSTGRSPSLVVETHGSETTAVTATVLVAMALAMVLVGLVATAGFVVIAQRRQRQLGLLAAIGAGDRHLRLVMAANGALVGAAAALTGALLGVGGWIATAPAIETAANHRIDRLDLPWEMVATSIVLAIVMATLAAWWPARAVARMPVMRALSGRPTEPRSVNRSTLTALAVTALGMGSIVASHPDGEVNGLFLIGGIIAVVIGVVFAAPAAIGILTAPAARLPFAVRLALRDLSRYRARAASAVAAITVGLGISVTVLVLAQANVHRSDEGNLSNRQVLVQPSSSAVNPTPGQVVPVPGTAEHAVSTIASTLGHTTVFALDQAVAPPAAESPNIRLAIDLARKLNEHSFRFVAHAYVATPAILRRYGIDPASVAASTDLLTSNTGDLRLLDPTSRDPGVAKVQHVALPAYSSGPSALITPSALRRHRWTRERTGWLLESSKPLTHEQIRAVRQAAAAAGLTAEARSSQDDLATIRTVATIAGMVLALAIVAMTVGLIRSEATRDVRTLTATGASPRTRRAVTGATAGAVALLGGLLGTTAAYLALAAGYRTDLGQLSSPPVAQLLTLALGLPAAAAVIGFALAGREPSTFSRQSLD
jgi:putative ABC transport system permease protein